VKKTATSILLPLFFSLFLIGNTLAKDLFWVNNSGSWNDAKHWSYTSGGASANKIPTANDNVFFDENSFSLPYQKVEITSSALCNKFTCSSNIPFAELLGAKHANLFISGSLEFSNTFYNKFNGDIYFNAKASKNTIQSANQKFLGNVIFDGMASVWSLQNHLILDKSKDIQLKAGTFVSANKYIQAANFVVSNSQNARADLGNSILILTNKNASNLVLSSSVNSKAKIIFNAAAKSSSLFAIIDSIDVTVTPPLCNGDSNAIVEVDSVYTITPGVYSYALTDGNSVYMGNPMTNIPAGTYILSVTNLSNNEEINEFVIINDPPPIIIPSYTKTSPKCFGDCNGKVRANPIGGTPSYSYLWNNGQTGQTDSLLCAGTVSVTVTDSKGCFKTFSTILTQPNAIALSIAKTNITCNGVCDGTVDATVTGGTSPFSIIWTPGGVDPLTSLCPGTYKVLVTDASGCIKRDSVILTQPPALILNVVKNDASCNGVCDGDIAVTPSGGRAPYTFSWAAPIVSTSNTISNLCAGTYTVFVRDSSNCLVQQTITIDEPNAFNVSINASQVTCFGLCNGSAVATISGGSGPYSFSWNTGVLTSSISNLCIGTYTLFVTDANNCATSASTTITQPNVLFANQSNTDATCFGDCDATANLAPSGGTPPYTFIWTLGNQTSQNLTGLCVGAYSYTITDSKGCTVQGSVTINQPLPITITITPFQPSCNGVCDGTATASGAGGVGPYSYSWSNGQLTPTATNLCPGIYTVEVTDSKGCKQVSSTTVPQTPLLTIGVATTTSSCGICTGTATVTPVGGTPPYQYSWSNGQTTTTATNLCVGNYSVVVTDSKNCVVNSNVTVDPVVVIFITSSGTSALCANSCNGTATANASGGTLPYTFTWYTPNGLQTTQTAVGLCAGLDSVLVTDANGCFSTAYITFTDPPVLLNNVSTKNSTCNGICDGTAISIPSGGTPPYTLSWSAVPQTTNNVNGLCAGAQSVTLIDNNGCELITNFTITEPPVLAANEVIVKSQCLLNNGSILITPSGGTAPYSLSWGPPLTSFSNFVSNLAAGSYTVTIFDAVSCEKEFTFIVSDATGPTITSSVTNTSCPNSCDGSITTSSPIGVGPFTYLWTPGNSTATSISNLCAGNYSLLVTDGNGCATNLNDTIDSPSPILSNAVVVNTSCGGQCNGSITLSTSGGTGTYSYSWSNGALTGNISGLCVGTYIVQITDDNNCVSFDTLMISEPAILNLSISQTNVTCNGVCDGQLIGVASGGTIPYTYLWSNGPTIPSIALLCPNTYSLTVTDANGCQIISSATITEPAVLAATTSAIPNSCLAACDGEVNVLVNGGTPPYTYLWSPGNSTNPLQTNLCAGTYTVTVTDFNNCSINATAIVDEPTLITVNSSITSPTCNGACDGTITAQATGGNGPYTYSWSFNALTSPTITNLCAGSYTVFVTDLNGCTASQLITLTQPDILLANAISTNPNCLNACNGAATTAASGGTLPYTYLWSPGGQVTPSVTSLCVGAISVTVTDSNGCVVTQNLNLINPPPIAIQSGVTPTNCSACNGALSVFPSGGAGGPYTYSWSPTAQTGQIAQNLCAGLYTVFVTDNVNCQQPFSLLLNNSAGPNSDTASIVNATCNGLCNGSISVIVSGGTLPYTYSWLPSGPSGTSVLTNQCAGSYILQTTDMAGCIYLSNDTISEPLPIIANDSIVDISCTGLADAQIYLFPSGGTGSYTYSWNPPVGASTSSVSNLAANVYNVTVTDSNNCTALFNYTISNPPAIQIQQSHTDLTCNGVCNGTASVTASGGTPPYSYSWSSALSDTAAQVGNLCAGVYTVFVTDARGCIQTANVIIDQPSAILANLNKNNIKCFGQCNGSAKVTPSGGIAPYTFSWVGLVSSSDSVSGLCAGNYAVNITDSSGCIVTIPVTISEPGLLNGNISAVDISCNGKCDGTATALTVGGTAPYSYLWSPGNITSSAITALCAGTYVLTILDSNNCTVTQSAVINEPAAITTNFVTINPICNTNTGTISVTTSGGTPGYSYLWSPGGFTNDTITNLTANLYNVQITDSRGCNFNASVPLSTTAFTVNKLSINVSCFGSCDGLASVTPNGGAAPYTYLWTPGGLTTDSVTNLCPGTYFPSVTDSNGCVVFETISIIEPSQVQAILTSTNATCGLCDGTAQVSGTGGTGNYSYLWSINQTSFNVNTLCAGTYSVQVTDNSGCSSTSNFNISNSTGPSSEIISQTNNSCNGACDGTASITPIGGQAPYTYYWLQSGSTSNSVSGLCAGTYDFEITDANGCKRVSSLTITEPPAIQPGNTFVNATCGLCDGSISLNPSGGAAPYTYSWNSGQNTASISSLCAGIYTVSISDSNGCSTTVSLTLNNWNAPSISHSTINATCFGSCDGAGFANAFGGTPPYQFQWNTGQIGDTVYGFCAGNYFITVTDANNCKSNATISITEPTPLVFSLPYVNDASCGICNGAAAVIPNGGTLPYTILWSSGDTGSFANNLCAGLYSIFMRDNSECKASATINISNLTGPTVAENVTNETCPNLCDGTVSLTPSGGTPPYTYFWLQGSQSTSSLNALCAGTYDYQVTDSLGCIFTSAVTINATSAVSYNEVQVKPSCGLCNGSITVNPSGGAGGFSYSWSPSGATTASISNLCAGIYTLNMTDASGCILTKVFTLNNSTGPGLTSTSVDAQCNGSCNGAATVNASGSSSPFTYSWIPTGQISPSISGLCAGNYTARVTDTAGCVAFTTVVISEPLPILFSISNAVNASCNQCNGSATIIPSGGVLSNSVLWSNGDVGLTASNLCAGVYSVALTDAAGCYQTKNVTISNIAGPQVTASKTDESCAGACNGTANLIASSSAGPISYYWLFNGSTTSSLNSLCAGSYDYQVSDTNGCKTTGNLTITPATTVALSFSKISPNCGACDGVLSVAATGGTGAYTYAWIPSNPATASISNLCAGIYISTVTDGNGCAQTDTITLGNSTGPTLTYTSTNITCNNSCNGTITATASGINPGYSYLWLPGNQVTNTINGLCAGNYIVEATDNLGCKGFQQITLSEPNPIAFSLSQITDVLCFGDSSGSITIIPSGGTIPYQYLWSITGDTTATISNLPNGSLFVTITDANGCDTVSPTLIISTPLPITATAQVTNATCTNSPDGAINLTPSGGTAPYTFSWNDANASTTEDVSGLISGVYSVTIIDANGCRFIYTDTIIPLVVVQANAGPDDTLCFTNQLTLQGNGGVTYKWFVESSSGLTFIDTSIAVLVSPSLGLNTYVLVAYNGACSDSDKVNIFVNPLPATDAGPDQTIISGASVQLNANGGITGSTYLWSPGLYLDDSVSAFPVATPLETITYAVKITSPTGCTATDSITITVRPTLDISNGITPNGDGKNDIWEIDGIQTYPNCQVEIYNRWGELLFSSTGYTDKWDGKYKGKDLPVGTYYYIIDLRDEVYTENFTGPITILR
jgi:gliding motility-associated-like protein